MAGNEPPEEVRHLVLGFISCDDEEVDEEVDEVVSHLLCSSLTFHCLIDQLAKSGALYVIIDYKQGTHATTIKQKVQKNDVRNVL